MSGVGLYFDPVSRMTHTGQAYVVPYEVSSEDLMAPLKEVKEQLDDVIWRTGSIEDNDTVVVLIKSHFKKLSDSIDVSVNLFENYFAYFSDANNHIRTRGAVDIIGTVSNALFGTAQA